MRVLETVRDLRLPDAMVFSGAVYQPVWNRLTGRPLEHGLKDYDLAYFDASDIGWDAEDAVIRRVSVALSPDLAPMVEVRNQARVHLWFESRFGELYAPLSNSAEALERFVATAFAIGARLSGDGELEIIAPFGLEDLFAMRLRPTRDPPAKGFARAAASAIARWPELTLVS